MFNPLRLELLAHGYVPPWGFWKSEEQPVLSTHETPLRKPHHPAIHANVLNALNALNTHVCVLKERWKKIDDKSLRNIRTI